MWKKRQPNRKCLQNLDSAASGVTPAGEHRPTAWAAPTLEPDTDGDVDDAIVFEQRYADLQGLAGEAAVAVQAACLLGVDAGRSRPHSPGRVIPPVTLGLVECYTRQGILPYCPCRTC